MTTYKKYRVSVNAVAVRINGPRPWCSWWNNYTRSFTQAVDWQNDLAKYNCTNVDNTEYLDFDTEEDFLIFKLKFG